MNVFLPFSQLTLFKGLGKNLPGMKSLQLGENTIQVCALVKLIPCFY